MTRRALLLSLSSLLLGMALGIGLERFWLGRARGPHPPPDPAQITAHFKDELDLSDAQAQEVLAILKERQGVMTRAFARVEPELEQAMSQSNWRIEQVLKPEQAVRFREMVARFEKRRAAAKARFGGP